ncbi:hypothetical protein [Terrabacter sp. NPDC080008]|uniref:hypothetical protein n=1 Tax=Terrabacter sp. NPDC080008 TaxID=3155176 RepID=UPI0034501CE2
MSQPRTEQDLAFRREKGKRTLPVSLLVLLGLVAMYLPLPKRFVAFLPLVLAVVLTVRLLRFLSPRNGREKVWPALTLAMVGLLLSTLAMQVAFYDKVSAYERCLDGAQTTIARGECDQQRDASMLGLLVR